MRVIKITPSGSTIKEPCGFADVSGCVSGRGKGVLQGLTRTCERSTPDAASCDDSKFAACVCNDQGYAKSGLRVGRGLSPIRPRGVGRDSRRAGGRRTSAAFAAAKAGLRDSAQAVAREFGPLGLHVARVIIDGGIDGDRLNSRFPQRRAEKGAHGLLDIDAIAETYWQIHWQHQSAWSHEVDLRPFKELFSADYKLCGLQAASALPLGSAAAVAHARSAHPVDRRHRNRADDDQSLPCQGTNARCAKRTAISRAKATAAITKIPMITTSVTRNCAADCTMNPSPRVAATNSAATSVDQPPPRPMRMPVRISGSAVGSTTCRSTCHWVAPMDRAALTRPRVTPRTPAAVEIATGAKMAR